MKIAVIRVCALALSSAVSAAGATLSVRVSETRLFGDMDCFKIETPTATYLYGKRGAGFASIIDLGGHDWISYRHGGKSEGNIGDFRNAASR